MSFKHTALSIYLTEVFMVDIVSRASADFAA
jgi:hypothetical protein